MNTALQPYPSYKPSGLPWLGRIPTHWGEKRGKYFFREVDERSVTGDEQLLSVSHVTGVTPRKANVTMFMAESNAGHKICRPGDLVINTMWAWMAAMGVSKQVGLVSPAYGVYRPLRDDLYVSEYVDHLLRGQPYASEYLCRSTGIRASRLRLYPDDFLDIRIVRPPVDEQEAMVRFIGHHDRIIRRFIRNRRRLIEVLNEQKQAIINRAVTRGIHSDAPLKPSGVDWLGDIPKHWEVAALRLRYDQCLGKMVDAKRFTGDHSVPYLRNTDVQWGRINTDDLPMIDIAPHERERFTVRPGDLLVCEGGDVGRCAFWTGQLSECGFQKALHRLRPLDSMRDHPRFLYYCMFNASKQGVFAANGSENTIAHLTGVKLRAHRFAFPPIEEQVQIAAQLDDVATESNRAVATAEREIDLVCEYRTRLIVDVVTGKLDVRHAATSDGGLPAPSDRQAQPKRAANVHFRRSVFAAEIVHRLHDEPTFGHVKFEKLIFLCEKRCGVDTGSTYHRQAAGPYDNRALRSIDSQIKKQKWYEARKGARGYRYVPLEKAGAHKEYFDRYFSDVASGFDEVIDTFRRAKTVQCEIVATLYAAWEDLLAQGSDVTDDEIVEEVLHHWHPSKQQIDGDRWRTAIGWMKERGLTPRAGDSDGADVSEGMNDEVTLGDDAAEHVEEETDE